MIDYAWFAIPVLFVVLFVVGAYQNRHTTKQVRAGWGPIVAEARELGWSTTYDDSSCAFSGTTDGVAWWIDYARHGSGQNWWSTRRVPRSEFSVYATPNLKNMQLGPELLVALRRLVETSRAEATASSVKEIIFWRRGLLIVTAGGTFEPKSLVYVVNIGVALARALTKA